MALGDSFTEGVGDPRPGGGMRGWADLVAEDLAARTPGFAYANLAIRGRRFDQIADEQVAAARTMGADLISFSGGGNDALRKGFDVHELMTKFDRAVATLAETGAEVLLFRFPDMSIRLPLRRVLLPRIIVMNDSVTAIAERRGAKLVDLFGDEAFNDPALWDSDRLHLNPAGHRRVADQVLAVLGVAEAPGHLVSEPVLATRAADLRWAAAYLRPWVQRRLTGRSSGDGLLPKRADLAVIGN